MYVFMLLQNAIDNLAPGKQKWQLNMVGILSRKKAPTLWMFNFLQI